MTNKINYIQKVELSGLWNKFDIVWNLNSDVNILAGINGSGKTTILNCISWMILTGVPFDISEKYIEIKYIGIYFNNGKHLFCEYITEESTIEDIYKYDFSLPYKEYKDFLSTKKNTEDLNLKINRFSFVSSPDIYETLNELHESINTDIISTFDNSLKPSEAVKKLSDDNVKTELDWEIYHLQKKYLDYQLNISKRKESIFEDNKSNTLFDYITEQYKIIKYPQTRFLEIIDDLFLETGKSINKDKNQIEFLLDDKKITPFQLSSGEKQLLIILLTVLVQDNKPSILFMDEPEISLHIEWQKKIIQYIRELNPNVQIIIATHSPALIMEGWQDKVFEVRDLIVKDNTKS